MIPIYYRRPNVGEAVFVLNGKGLPDKSGKWEVTEVLFNAAKVKNGSHIKRVDYVNMQKTKDDKKATESYQHLKNKE